MRLLSKKSRRDWNCWSSYSANILSREWTIANFCWSGKYSWTRQTSSSKRKNSSIGCRKKSTILNSTMELSSATKNDSSSSTISCASPSMKTIDSRSLRTSTRHSRNISSWPMISSNLFITDTIISLCWTLTSWKAENTFGRLHLSAMTRRYRLIVVLYWSSCIWSFWLRLRKRLSLLLGTISLISVWAFWMEGIFKRWIDLWV